MFLHLCLTLAFYYKAGHVCHQMTLNFVCAGNFHKYFIPTWQCTLYTVMCIGVQVYMCPVYTARCIGVHWQHTCVQNTLQIIFLTAPWTALAGGGMFTGVYTVYICGGNLYLGSLWASFWLLVFSQSDSLRFQLFQPFFSMGRGFIVGSFLYLLVQIIFIWKLLAE